MPIELGDSDNIFTKFNRKMINRYYLNIVKDPNMSSSIRISKTPVDIVIPLVEKDMKVAGFTIDSVRQLLMHPIGTIFIVSPESPKLRKFAKQKNAVFILENTLLPKFKKNPPQRGWYIQQYLKLAADQLVNHEHYFVIDGDTVLIRPQVYIYKGKTLFNISNQYSFKRKKMVEEALEIHRFRNVDFVSHQMLFEKSKVRALKAYLEKIHRKSWQDALNELETADELSEYELYANFVDKFYPHDMKIVPSRNEGLPSDRIGGLDAFRAALSSFYKSFSFHHFQTFSYLANN